MDWNDVLWAGMALVLVFEGLFPLVAPAAWRRVFQQLTAMRDGQIRFYALLSVIIGLALLLAL
jgi:uncharacterized protein YjeT (DUF2065 family)